MGRVVSIHQPAYLPWLGYFDKIRRADLFIYLDSVQFQKQSFQNRNKIRTADGWTWLTVPVETKGRLYETPLKDLPINNRVNWRRKHRAAIEMNYRKAPRFEPVMSLLDRFYAQEWEHLSDLCYAMMTAFNRELAVDSEIRKASELKTLEGGKSDLLLSICRAVGATTYLSGALGQNYLDVESFERAGIDVLFQDYRHPVYAQLQPDFLPNMAVIDLLMNEADPAAVL